MSKIDNAVLDVGVGIPSVCGEASDTMEAKLGSVNGSECSSVIPEIVDGELKNEATICEAFAIVNNDPVARVVVS